MGGPRMRMDPSTRARRTGRPPSLDLWPRTGPSPRRRRTRAGSGWPSRTAPATGGCMCGAGPTKGGSGCTWARRRRPRSSCRSASSRRPSYPRARSSSWRATASATWSTLSSLSTPTSWTRRCGQWKPAPRRGSSGCDRSTTSRPSCSGRPTAPRCTICRRSKPRRRRSALGGRWRMPSRSGTATGGRWSSRSRRGARSSRIRTPRCSNRSSRWCTCASAWRCSAWRWRRPTTSRRCAPSRMPTTPLRRSWRGCAWRRRSTRRRPRTRARRRRGCARATWTRSASSLWPGGRWRRRRQRGRRHSLARQTRTPWR
mmetsp:Transcript_7746/g.25957  ORF Transcript_7746/g.25957 Transcript_7746/m.25957 type:complete len:314 (-) Transcript_7746:1017-1958(-)